VNGFIDHLYTSPGTTITDHWHTQTSVVCLLQSILAVSWQRLLPREILQLPALRSSYHSRPCRTLPNWVPGWRPFHSNLLVLPSQVDFQLTTDNWTLSLTNQLLHVTSLTKTADNSSQQLTRCQRVSVGVILRQAVYRQSLRLGDRPLETHGHQCFSAESCGHSPYVTSFLKEDGSAVYNFSWHSPAQSFSGPSSAGLMATFYCLRFETPPTWRARSPYLYPQEQGGLVIPLGTGFPFRRLLRLAGLRWRLSKPPPHGHKNGFIYPPTA
jgi:hypothetical protein